MENVFFLLLNGTTRTTSFLLGSPFGIGCYANIVTKNALLRLCEYLFIIVCLHWSWKAQMGSG